MRHGSIPSLGKVNANFNLGNKLDVGSASPKWKLSPRYYFCSISKYTIFPIKKLHWTAQQQQRWWAKKQVFNFEDASEDLRQQQCIDRNWQGNKSPRCCFHVGAPLAQRARCYGRRCACSRVAKSFDSLEFTLIK